MSYTPPFTITAEVLNLVAQISEQVGRFNVGAFNDSPRLRRQNRVKTITGTLAIEGNTLSEEQITAIIEGGPCWAVRGNWLRSKAQSRPMSHSQT